MELSRPTARRRHRRLRWGVGLTSVALVVAGALSLVVGGSSAAAAGVSPGEGSASAQAIAIQPHEGSLATGLVMGEALAGHTNSYARAQSQGLDLGALGLALKGYDCSNLTAAQGGPQAPTPQIANSIPTALEVETPVSGGTATQTIGAQQNYDLQDLANSTPDQSKAPPPPTYGWTEYGLASSTPYAEADTTLVETIGASLLSVSDVASKAWSGVVDGQREAGASVDIGDITVGSGAASVSLDGLHWQAVYPSGGSAKPSTTFTVGKLLVGGVALPVATAALTTLQTVINSALAPLGIQMALPTLSTFQSTVSLSPLELEVVPSPERDTVLGDVLSALQPITNPLFLDLEDGFAGEPNSLLDVLCKSDDVITVLDIALASITGGGYADAAFGGVSASSQALPTNPFQLNSASPFSISPGHTQYIPGTAGTPAVAGTPPTPGSSAPTPGSSATPATSPLTGGTSLTTPTSVASTSPGSQPIQRASASGFSAGGPLLGIGLGGLGLLALLAEGDRRMMRRAQRTVTFEE